MIGEKVASIYSTNDYSIFKFLEGNRSTDHYKKLMRSIQEIGVLYQPILVNEKYEIVEGQGRFLAMKSLNLPVLYAMQEGIGIKECRFLNSNSTNWKNKDYIHSYAVGTDYVPGARYLELLGKEFPGYASTFLYACTNVARGYVQDKHSFDFRTGEIDITEEDYEYGRKVMSYIREFEPYLRGLQGRKNCMHSALLFCYRCDIVDNDYLLEKVSKLYGSFCPIANTSQAVTELERVYNANIRGRERIYLKSPFEEYVRAHHIKNLRRSNGTHRD